eukprot:scaffold9208_cov98-Isochrysis_galbana.AAC.14
MSTCTSNSYRELEATLPCCLLSRARASCQGQGGGWGEGRFTVEAAGRDSRGGWVGADGSEGRGGIKVRGASCVRGSPGGDGSEGTR